LDRVELSPDVVNLGLDRVNLGMERLILGFAGEDWEVVRDEKHSLNRDVYKFLAPLSPWGNYTYRLSAVNAYGTSAFTHAEDTVSCRTPSDVPHSNPRGVRIFGTQPDNLVIAWEPMRRRDWNAPGLRYLIRYREHLADGDTAKMDREEQELVRWTEFIVDDPLANETTIRVVCLLPIGATRTALDPIVGPLSS
jgi:hypothetical protein